MLTNQDNKLGKPLSGGASLQLSEREFREAAGDHYDAVYRFCARRVGIERAADAAQETFLKAQRSLANFRGDSSLLTWFFGIAMNECRAQLRRSKAEPAPIRLQSTKEPSSASPEGPVVNRHILQQALAQLSAEHREVVLLHEGDGLTYEEAALVLQIPVGTVKSRLYHAFAQLRRSLEGGMA